MLNSRYSLRLARENDLSSIRELQKANHYTAVSGDDIVKEGFVSVETDLPLLRRMMNDLGIVVVEDQGKVIGYEFPLGLSEARGIPLLKPFVQRILALKYEGKELSKYKVVIEGQICLDREHKGKGLVMLLHQCFVKMLTGKFELLITEISNQNPRSLYVHKEKLDFQVIDEYRADGRHWYVLLQDLRV